MDFIRQWIVTILSVIIFITFVEILLPNSNNRKYINVVVGLLIMLVILKPVMGVINQQIPFGEEILQNTNQMEMMTVKNHYNHVDLANKENIINLYKQQLKEQMLDRIENKMGYPVDDLRINIVEEEGETFGMINSVEVYLLEEKEAENPKGVSDISVNVVIDGKKNNKPDDDSILLNNEGDEIKKDLSDFYSISQDSIIVTLLKNKK
ncbi:stage III sporulation protein AF [Alkaliphilus serpentinus]|uniref:Stage III sporulation protein AF n=1 Tax=Alkaliphilus serpentinus TaxID=1482731 RepID=A0A833HMH2_9FIRM|nr:stage III sporulation protein AF [Alkaliphilus serpentinus]KAB3527574.1 stage III sporulation protein AF [Alkaliphilus serpentinus]